MQNSNESTTFERGFFRRSFQEFDENSFFNALQERLQEQPYHRKNKGLKTTLLALSYVLNAISALSASYLIFWLTETLTGVTILAYVLAGVFLIFLEQLKRKSSNEFFQVYFFQKRTALGWLVLSLFCFALSVSSTYFGTEKGTIGFAPEATTLPINASEEEIQEEIKRLEDENKELKAQKNSKGITFFPSQSSIKSNKKMIVSLRERLSRKQDQREEDDRENKGEHKEKIKVTATTLAWILVFLELVFEGCIAYIWYYYYRSFTEWKLIQEHQNQREQNQNTTHQAPPQNIPSSQTPPPLPHPYKIPPLNGTDVKNENKALIGYFTDKQRLDHIAQKNPSVQACTDLYREDLYTVPHKYLKGGKEIIVHYTKPQVKSRISQYEREITEAQTKEMGEEIIENRKAWLNYWKGKFNEIDAKAHKAINP